MAHSRAPRAGPAARVAGSSPGRAGCTGPAGHRRCPAGPVQPARPGLEPATLAAGPARGARLCAIQGHAARGPASCRWHPDRPCDRALPAVWVPNGHVPSEGTYVRYDHEALISILVLEAHRAGALVIGEDLGVVEPWVRDYLRDRGILGTSILWFENDSEGTPLPAEAYRELCLATVTTHDLPPTAGFLAAEHIDLRHQLGLLTRPVELERELADEDRQKVLDMLVDRGLLRPEAQE